MKISYNWLKEYLNLDMTAEKTADLLTDIGLEVESIDLHEEVRGGLKGVVIGEVIQKRKHPNADRLALAVVDIGLENPLNIVCGAPNLSEGQKVPVATIGTWLYDGDNKFKIKKGKIRGEVSEGMICGEDEIGLGEDTDGIMVLDKDAKAGIPAAEFFKLQSDVIFDIGLTPNRSDAMSHYGVARDLKTVLNRNGGNFKICVRNVDAFVDSIKETQKISVNVSNNHLCPRYSGISISDVKVKESPEWLKKKLLSIGQTPINNIVDITNYILHDTGQPLHAFDIQKIKGGVINVDTVKSKTKIITLDEEERELSSEDLIISNDKHPMCIAGVFGGLNSGVSMDTKNVFIESALFDPISIRKTAKRHNLNTESSFRFERGVDPNMVIYALKRAALLIVEIAEGKISSPIIDHYPKPYSYKDVDL
jgi:phenylalanyl-tRNA synthetase beta chain